MAVNALAAGGDVLIAFVLCFMLQKSRTGFKRFTYLFISLSVLLKVLFISDRTA